jgi:hypothetical protein
MTGITVTAEQTTSDAETATAAHDLVLCAACPARLGWAGLGCRADALAKPERY